MSDQTSIIAVGDEHYAAIGKVAVSWSFFELLIDAEIWRLANIEPDMGACITSQITGSSRKLDALISLIRYRIGEGPLTKRLSIFAQATTSLAERRNRVVHDPLIRHEGDEHPGRLEITARKKLRAEIMPQELKSTLLLGVAIHQHATAFRAIIADVDAAVAARAAPSPDKPQPA